MIMITNKMRAIHPGEILCDEIEARRLSRSAFARALKVPANRITQILDCKRAITADTALRLARYLGTSAEMWMNMQASYDLKIMQVAIGKEIEKSVERAA